MEKLYDGLIVHTVLMPYKSTYCLCDSLYISLLNPPLLLERGSTNDGVSGSFKNASHFLLLAHTRELQEEEIQSS
jgi:hypothetical protein